MDFLPPLLPSHEAPRVLILGVAPAQVLDVAGPAEVFAQANHLGDHARYAVEVVIEGADARAATGSAVTLAPGRPLSALLDDSRPLDTFIVCGGEGARTRADEPALRGAVSALASRSRRVASVCTGAFVLAAAGLLDGRRATTHWRWCGELQRRHKPVRVEHEPIFTRDGRIWTSAGVTAGIDLALALVEDDHGHAPALAIARELVMFLRRPGGQGQFSETLAAQTAHAARGGGMRDLVAWMADNVHRGLTVEQVAARSRFGPRQFARVFARETGTTPGRMLDRLRVEAARRRLEAHPHALAAVAAACGFGGEEAMRRAFLRHLGTPPGAYRDRFRAETPSPSFQETHA